jgi:hypothetical protein
MLIKTRSKVNIEVNSASHVIFPIEKLYGEEFDAKIDGWESDRAWAVQKNRLIYNPITKKVDLVVDIC